MRTFIYVDGLNLYYGAVKDTRYKWLDPKRLFQNILNDENRILKIKYFTAPVKKRLGDPFVGQRQNTYIRALRAYISEIEVINGFFRERYPSLPLADGSGRKVRVVQAREKGSDVNLAVHLLNDAWLDAYDCAVLVSNDGDFAEALNLVKKRFPKKIIGLITPQSKPQTYALKACSDFHYVIRQKPLRASQLPNPIPGTRIHKPDSW